MSAPHINLSSVLFVCQKLSKSVEIWRSYSKNNFAQFFETRCRYVSLMACLYVTQHTGRAGFQSLIFYKVV